MFTLNISSGLLLKFLSMPLLFIVYKEVGKLENVQFTTTWLTLYTIVAGLSTLDFGVGSSIKNHLIHDSNFKFNLPNLMYSYLFVGFANCLFFLSLILSNGITFIEVNMWFYLFSCLFFLLYPFLKFSISIIQSEKKDWLASCSFFVVNVLLYFMILFSNINELDDKFYYYGLYLSFTIPLIALSFLYLKKIIKKSVRKSVHLRKLYLVTAKSFFFTQIILFLMNSTNDILFNVVGDKTLINYQYGFRIFSISVIFSAVISTVIWSNLGSKLREHYQLINGSSLGIYFVALFVLNCLLILITNPFMTIFFELDIMITSMQLFSLALMSTLLGFIFILTGFLNCLNIIDKQVFVLFSGLAVKFVLIYLVVNLFGEIDFVVVFCNIVSYLIIVIVYCTYLIKAAKIERGIASV